jgi:gliding motility-associated protein GldM
MVIIAGYENELEENFFSNNPGLNSRFIWRFTIDKYTTKELMDIFIKKMNDINWKFNSSALIDEKWFEGDGYSPRGKEIVSAIDKYVSDIKKVLGNDVKYIPFIKEIEKKFSTADIANKEGVKIKFLDYKAKGFPAVSTLTFVTAMQNDVKNTEAGAFNLFLGNALKTAASMKNFQAIVVLEKNAYFQGETVKGKVVLGRYDANTVPTSFNGPGKIENGQAVISTTAGSIGEQKISGKFGFLEDGKEIPLSFEGTYVVVPRPNQAIISADKMNVVYRGVPNPISISVPGIASNKVNASAPGMSKVGDGKFMLKAGSGSEVKINVTATMPDGKTMSSAQVFRIKGLPAPTGKVGGSEKNSGQKSNLEVCTVTATMEDFDFPVTVNVTQFNIKVPGQPTIVVSGNKMDSRARAAIAKASRGDIVIISEIKASFQGIDQVAKRVSACTYEIK